MTKTFYRFKFYFHAEEISIKLLCLYLVKHESRQNLLLAQSIEAKSNKENNLYSHCIAEH